MKNINGKFETFTDTSGQWKAFLSPCPFCAESDIGLVRTCHRWHVYCSICNIDGPGAEYPRLAVNLWNNRPSYNLRILDTIVSAGEEK